MASISLCMIVKNEEDVLANCNRRYGITGQDQAGGRKVYR